MDRVPSVVRVAEVFVTRLLQVTSGEWWARCCDVDRVPVLSGLLRSL